MDKLKVLLYGDIDMNIIDGSSIWITSVINTMMTNENISIDLLLKTPLKVDTVIRSVEKLDKINIINPFEKAKFKGRRMQVDEASKYILKVYEDNGYDCILIRGNNLCEEVCKIEKLRDKLISYIIPEKYIKEVHEQNQEKDKFKYIYNNSRYIISQTEESKEKILKMLDSPKEDKIIILPPMIPNLNDNIPSFTNKKNKLIYSGQFCKNWYIYNILKAYEKLSLEDDTVSLNVAGNKFQKDIDEVKDEIISILQDNKSISWINGVSRNESTSIIEDSDIGIAWRSREVDNDDSVEISTKVLEYSRAGIPVILNRTKMYEKLFGDDYPLFIDSDSEELFIQKCKLALYDEDIYYKSATTVYSVAKKYTFSNVYKSIHSSLWSFKNDKINLLFASHDLKFLTKFIDYCEKSGRYNIKIDKWQGHCKHDVQYSKECLQWADIIFCEWGLGNVKWYSNNKKEYQKLIVRIHLQELTTTHYKEFNMDNIDKVICITPYMFEEIYKVMEIPREKISMIFNYIDCKHFDKPKTPGCEYNLGIVGICPKRKRLDLAIDIFEKLWQKDKRYKLYIKGKHPKEYPWLWKRQEERAYYEKVLNKINNSKFKDSIIFDGFGSDLDQWYMKVGFLLSPSDFEGSHVSVAEALAAGTVPIIFNWKGSDTIYQEKFIVPGVEEAVDLIKKSSDLIGNTKLKEYSNTHFEINQILKEMEKQFI